MSLSSVVALIPFSTSETFAKMGLSTPSKYSKGNSSFSVPVNVPKALSVGEFKAPLVVAYDLKPSDQFNTVQMCVDVNDELQTAIQALENWVNITKTFSEPLISTLNKKEGYASQLYIKIQGWDDLWSQSKREWESRYEVPDKNDTFVPKLKMYDTAFWGTTVHSDEDITCTNVTPASYKSFSMRAFGPNDVTTGSAIVADLTFRVVINPDSPTKPAHCRIVFTATNIYILGSGGRALHPSVRVERPLVDDDEDRSASVMVKRARLMNH